ncbi:MAG: DUF3825 domain-containing protein [Erysipelotrichales bacterium]
MNKYLNKKEELPKIKRYANLGGQVQFDKKLNYLINLAEEERWNQTDIHTGKENSTIFYYIVHTFERCYDQDKLFISKDGSCSFFNTGLMTAKGDEILGKFERNKYYNEKDNSSNYWYFKEFLIESGKIFMNECSKKPEIATYFSNYNELYFDPACEIVIDFNHIYKDNFQRLPMEFQIMEAEVAGYVFEGFLRHTKKKIQRNNRIPVPQFYNNKIMFLIPVKVFESKTIVIALEKINNQYRGNTILSVGMAYNCARLVNKPEDDWLLNNFINQN